LNNTGIPDLAPFRGLPQQEAQRRLRQEGYNELPSTRKRSLLAIALNVVREPMFLLLIGGGAIYLLLGDVREALVLLGSILVIMGITFYQEQKTERAIAQRHVLTRRMPAIETLGSATVLCVDKTGTLIENRMSVRSLFTKGISYDVQAEAQPPLPEEFHELVELSVLASQQDPFDPMEQALRELGLRSLAGTEHLPGNWTLLREYPLSPHLLAISHVWKPSRPEAAYVIAAKGAPEAIVDLCHLDEAHKEEVATQVSRMASEGLRVLGVARARFQKASALPTGQHDFPFEFVGLVGLADPVRPTVPAAIQECYTAGIRVVMITGDYPVTAQHIGRQIGLKPVEACITGPELDEMRDATLQERIKSTTIFARVVPEQKLRLVNALKANGEVVAMTGDGVNDAPALKSAHIGIAMGKRGTDVAREAAALVLLDDDFSSIVQAVKLGRRIYDNIGKALTYILAVHVPIAGMALLPLLFG
jgi:Ca2+-transporting ATPase